MPYKEETLEFLGITKWQNAGYKGKGIKIMSDEKICEKIHPDVISPKGFKDKRSHGDDVMAHIKLVAPEATLIAFPLNGSFTSDSYKSECVNYIKENKVNIFTTSCTGSYPNGGRQKAIQDCIEAGCIFFGASGNEGDRGISEEIKYEGYLAIGGVKPFYNAKTEKYEWNKLSKVNYSSVGEELDYVTIAEVMGASGTSFCAPLFAGMCALVQQFFLEKTGRTLTRDELIKFIGDNLIDADDKGFDVRTGNGLFILPEISKIDISRYVPEYMKPTYIDYGRIPEVKEMKIKEMLLTPSEWNRPQTKIKPTAIAWHYVGNPNTSALANRNYFENLSQTHTTKASCHYIIGLDGEILHLIPDDEMSYCTNQANPYTISVECCHPDSAGKFTEATYKSMIWLGKYLMDKYGIKENIRHYDVTGKCCPKWFVDNSKEWEIFKKELESEDENMLKEIMERLGISEEELKEALIQLVSHKIDKNKKPDWLKPELEEAIKKAEISDMTRPNDTATRIEVATMIYNSKTKGE